MPLPLVVWYRVLGLRPNRGRRDETLRCEGDSEVPLTERLVGILLAAGEARGNCVAPFLVTVACDVDLGINDDGDDDDDDNCR